MRNLAVVSVFVVCCAVVSVAQLRLDFWAAIPWDSKVRFESYNDDLAFEMFLCVEEVWAVGWGNEWLENRDFALACIDESASRWPDCDVFFVAIVADATTYFWPTDFYFVQGRMQYNVGYRDVLAIHDPFSGGRIQSGVIAMGLIAIPEGINMGEPFDVHYGSSSSAKGLYDPYAVRPALFLRVEHWLHKSCTTIVFSRGDLEGLEVTTLPAAVCAIECDHLLPVEGPSERVADEDGRVFWSWMVDESVPVGEYSLVLTVSFDDEVVTQAVVIQISD